MEEVEEEEEEEETLQARVWGWFCHSGGHWLVLSVSLSWVGTAQLARAAEQRAEQLQHHTIVPLMSWANTTAWIFLAIPHMLRCYRELGSQAVGGRVWVLLRTDTFSRRQPLQFFAVALATNMCYIAALHFLPASLNTAIFCTSPVFTLLLSALWLPQSISSSREMESDSCACLRLLWSRTTLSVALSVLGVLLIADPWEMAWPGTAKVPQKQGDRRARALGACLSLLAAWGTAVYQVYFKVTFGDKMKAEEIGLFLSYMGGLSTVIVGVGLLAAALGGVYPLQLEAVPWLMVAATAACSALFNFLIKFGLSVDSPMSMSLATQIGIPMNLLLDVAVVGVNIKLGQALGTLVMLTSFSLQQKKQRVQGRRRRSTLGARLLGL